MVLIHKLKQTESLDMEQFRQSSQDEPRSEEAVLSATRKPRKNDSSRLNRKRLASPPRRPTTRSQTSRTALKRKIHQSSALSDDIPPKTPTGEVDKPPPTSKPPAPPTVVRDVKLNPDVSAIPLAPPSGQYTFLGTSTQLFDRRGPRSRAVLPVPVPNLTKKSRGRRVPTIPVNDKDDSPKPGRLYVCKVEDCGKCFNRGEHLKRHIRSIHTHEKPFKCSHASCDKFFNRHDNLLQHLKVHKNMATSQDTEDGAQESRPNTPPTEVASARPLMIHTTPPAYSSFPSYNSRPAYTINMAVSSLRTELPSPTESLERDTTVRFPRFELNGAYSVPSPPRLLPANANHDDWQI